MLGLWSGEPPNVADQNYFLVENVPMGENMQLKHPRKCYKRLSFGFPLYLQTVAARIITATSTSTPPPTALPISGQFGPLSAGSALMVSGREMCEMVRPVSWNEITKCGLCWQFNAMWRKRSCGLLIIKFYF